VNIPIILLWVVLCTLALVKLVKKKKFNILGLLFVFFLAFLSILIGAQKEMKDIGVGSALCAIILGVLFSNVIFRATYITGIMFMKDKSEKEEALIEKTSLIEKTEQDNRGCSLWVSDCIPSWLKNMIHDEYYIKISLVLLAMDFIAAREMLIPAMLVSWVDTPVLVVIIYLLGVYVFRLKWDYSIVMAGAVSICGTSAANAIGSTVGASKLAISYPIAVMSFLTVPMIPSLPILFKSWLTKSYSWTSGQGGAWIGGTIDTTGAVLASSAIISEECKNSAAVVKMLQNCLIGPICLVLLLIWIKNKKDEEKKKEEEEEEEEEGSKQITCSSASKMLWERFPKFVLGFFLVCGFITALPNSEWKARAIALSLVASAWFETLGFVCIGLNIQLTEMVTKIRFLKLIPFYIVGQALDMITTGIVVNYLWNYF